MKIRQNKQKYIGVTLRLRLKLNSTWRRNISHRVIQRGTNSKVKGAQGQKYNKKGARYQNKRGTRTKVQNYLGEKGHDTKQKGAR